MIAKKILISAVIASSFALAFAASADTTGTATYPNSVTVRPPNHNPAMVLDINASGKVLLRGTIDSVSSNSLTIKSWGGTWTVNVPATASVLPQGVQIVEYKDGDFVGVEGTVNQGSSWTIDATNVRDWTAKATVQQEAQQNKQAVNSERPKTYQGAASNVTATSLTLTASNGTVYTVNIDAGAKILNKKWLTLSAADIANGDTVRVYGVNASGTISAMVVRDIAK